MSKIKINIYNIVGSSNCVDANDGEKIYEQIKRALNDNNEVELSFQNVEMITSAFLNPAVGQLYRDFSEKQIKNSLSVSEMAPEDRSLLKRVTESAKIYYKDPERMIKSLNDILGEDD